MHQFACTAAALSVFAFASNAMADFAGQPISGSLSMGSIVNGANVGAPDNNDGWTSGMHIFDIWTGGDRVYTFNWTGGSFEIQLFSNPSLCDVDLFVYSPGSYDDAEHYGITNGSPDVATLHDAAAGLYYIVVDSTPGAEGSFQLRVVPTPATAGLLAVAGVFAGRRRRA